MFNKQELLSKFIILCVPLGVLAVSWVFKDGVPKQKLNFATITRDSVLVRTATGDSVLIPRTLSNELFVFDEPMREAMLKEIAQRMKDDAEAENEPSVRQN